MSKISKEGYNQILIIKDALNSMFDKLSGNFYIQNDKTKVKDIEKLYTSTNIFESVKDEFESISNIVDECGKWEEVK
jgi:hypothetical protein